MEVVGSASAVAGLLGLVGHTLDGIFKLRAFFHDCAEASNSISNFLNKLNSLIQIIDEVKDFVRRLESADNSRIISSINFAALDLELDYCSNNVYNWLRIARECQPDSASGTKAIFKKFEVAASKNGFKKIFEEIESHKGSITLKLSILAGSWNAIQCSDTRSSFKSLNERLDQINAIQSSDTRSSFKSLNEKLDQINASRDVQHRLVHENLQHLHNDYEDSRERTKKADSQASERLERIEKLVSSIHGSIAGGSSVHSMIVNSPNASKSGMPHNIDASNLPAKCSDPMSLCVSDNDRNYNPFYVFGTSRDPANTTPDKWKQNYENSIALLQRKKFYYFALRLDGTVTESFQEIQDAGSMVSEALKNRIQSWNQGSNVEGLDMLLLEIMDWEPYQLFQACEQIRINEPPASSLIAQRLQAANSQHLQIKMPLAPPDNPEYILGVRDQLWFDSSSNKESCILLQAPHYVSNKDTDAQIDWERLLLSINPSELSNQQSMELDRTNTWLLRSLLEFKNLETYHRKYLPINDNLLHLDWENLVMRYWYLKSDSAQSHKAVLSTNGAVDSEGKCHSHKVLFPNQSCHDSDGGASLPHKNSSLDSKDSNDECLPFRDRKRQRMEEEGQQKRISGFATSGEVSPLISIPIATMMMDITA